MSENGLEAGHDATDGLAMMFAFLTTLLSSGRKRIDAARHGVGLPPTAVSALDAHLSTAIEHRNPPRSHDRLFPNSVDAYGAPGVGSCYCPAIGVLHHISFVPRHFDLPLDVRSDSPT